MAQTQDPWSDFFTFDYSKPTSTQLTLARMNQEGFGGTPTTSRSTTKPVASALSTATPPAAQTPPAAPAPRPAAPAPAPGATRFDRLRDGVRMQYETELAALKEREAQGYQVPPLSYKRAGERYNNAMRGIDAEESMEKRKEEGKRLRAERAAAPKPAATSTPSTSTPKPQPTQPTADVKGLVSRTSQGAIDSLAGIYGNYPLAPTASPETSPAASVPTPSAPASAPAPSPYTRPQDVGPPAPPPPALSTQEVLAALDPRVKKRFADAAADPTSALGYILKNSGVEQRNQMIRELAGMPAEEQLRALAEMDTQSSDRVFTDQKMNRDLSAAGMNKTLQDIENSLPAEYRQERDQLRREYASRFGVDWATMNEEQNAKFESDLNRRLAQKYPSTYGTSILPINEPKTFAEHLSKSVRDLDERSPAGMRLGTQLESAATLGSVVGPLAPVGAAIGTGAGIAQTVMSPTVDDDAALQELVTIGLQGKTGGAIRAGIREAQIDQRIAAERDRLARGYNIPPKTPPAPGQLPPSTSGGSLPPGGPTTPPPPAAPTPPKALPPASITDDALSEVASTSRPNPANASPASKSNLAERARASDPAVAARDAAATPSPGTGYAVKAPEEQGLLPGFRRSTAPEGARNQNVVREFQTGKDSPTFQVVTDPESGRTGAFTVLKNAGEGDRPVIFLNINGETVPFYRSQGGTSGKVAGEWYPFQGTDSDGWLIKGNIDQMKAGYNIPEVQKAQKYLNETFKAKSPEEAMTQMRRFFNNPVPDEANGARALLNRGAMQEGKAGRFGDIPEGRVNRFEIDAWSGTPESKQAALDNYRRYMRDRIGSMRGGQKVSTPEMAPKAPKDLEGQMMLDFEGPAAERAAKDAQFRSFVQDVLDGFNRGG